MSCGIPWIESLAKDAAYGLRGLRRQPACTLAAVLSLALGIGYTVNPDVALTEAGTLGERVDDSIYLDRMVATLSGFFGALALLLESSWASGRACRWPWRRHE